MATILHGPWYRLIAITAATKPPPVGWLRVTLTDAGVGAAEAVLAKHLPRYHAALTAAIALNALLGIQLAIDFRPTRGRVGRPRFSDV